MSKKLEKIQNLENYNTLSNEVLEINAKINKIFDILRDLTSFHPEVKKNYLNELERKPTKKIISGVKEYIKGNINANDLTSMKKFAFEKSKTKIFDKLSPNPKTTQNILQSDSLGEEHLDFINKKFMSKKTINISKKENNLASNKTIGDETFKVNEYNKKNTVSFGKNNFFESSKINNYIKKQSKNSDNFFNTQLGEKVHNIIEEENEINNNSINSLSDNDVKYITSMKNEKNKKDFNIQKFNKNRDNTPSIENNKNNDNINSKENKTINNNRDYKSINSNISENKKEPIIKSINNNNNNNNNNNQNRELKENVKIIKHYIQTDSENKNNNEKNNLIPFTKEDFIKKEFPFASNFNSKISKLNFQNINKSPITKSPQSQRKNIKNKISKGNKVIMNYNHKPKNQDKSFSPSIKKLYKTYSNFPKINHDNNISNPSSRDKITKTIKEDNFYRKEPRATSFIKYKKKILLMNPDDLPFNYFDKTFENILKNNLYLNINKSVRNNNHKINEINFFGKK